MQFLNFEGAAAQLVNVVTKCCGERDKVARKYVLLTFTSMATKRER